MDGAVLGSLLIGSFISFYRGILKKKYLQSSEKCEVMLYLTNAVANELFACVWPLCGVGA